VYLMWKYRLSGIPVYVPCTVYGIRVYVPCTTVGYTCLGGCIVWELHVPCFVIHVYWGRVIEGLIRRIGSGTVCGAVEPCITEYHRSSLRRGLRERDPALR
jgi:hypothetical protein